MTPLQKLKEEKCGEYLAMSKHWHYGTDIAEMTADFLDTAIDQAYKQGREDNLESFSNEEIIQELTDRGYTKIEILSQETK